MSTPFPITSGPWADQLKIELKSPWAEELVRQAIAAVRVSLAEVEMEVAEPTMAFQVEDSAVFRTAVSKVRDSMGGAFVVRCTLKAALFSNVDRPLLVWLTLSALSTEGQQLSTYVVGESRCDEQSIVDHGMTLALDDTVHLAVSSDAPFIVGPGRRTKKLAAGAEAFREQLLDTLAP